MTPLAWIFLGAAVVCVPLPSAIAARATGLIAAGRLEALRPTSHDGGRRPVELSRVVILCCIGVTVAAGWVAGIAIAAAVAVAAATACGLFASMLARRRDAGRRRELLATVRLLVAELEAGTRPPEAFAAAGAATPSYAEPFAAAAWAARAGRDVGAALVGVPDLRPLGHAWHVASVAGVPLATVLTNVAADVGAQQDVRRAVGSALAGPRASAGLLAGLPLLGIGLGAAMGAQPLPMLVGTPAGRLLCFVGVLLDAAGVLWTQWLIRRAER
ncbi:MAG: hypothetical protein JWO57_991 [Pseudonocardiales bacterium]|nr:hypothetical protein [Pseudonocardiales bacterium]